MTGIAGDATYDEALTRRYLAIHPEHTDWLMGLPAGDRTGLLTLWLDTFEGRRHALADDAERVALELCEAHSDIAEDLRRTARDLRQLDMNEPLP